MSACQFVPAPAAHVMPSAMPSMASRRAVRCSKTSGGSGCRSFEMIRVLAIVLPAFEDETIDPLRLHFAHERGQARLAGHELRDAMPAVTDHDERLYRELDDRCQEDPLLRIDLVVEVKAAPACG